MARTRIKTLKKQADLKVSKQANTKITQRNETLNVIVGIDGWMMYIRPLSFLLQGNWKHKYIVPIFILFIY